MAKILVIDDSPSMRKMVNFTLSNGGHDVTEAENGDSGILQAKSDQFDLVMTDMNMPGISGIEVTTQLRAMPNYKFIPILLLTTESANSTKNEGRKAGATGWIVKPFHPETLLNTVKKILH